MTVSEPQPSLAPLRPSVRFMLSHPAHFMALGFGAGLAPKAPGTVGTLWAWLAYLALQQWLTPRQMGLLIAISTVVGWWACTTTARHMRVADPGSIVWDEVVAFWLVLWLAMPMGLWGQVVAFGLFRFFDAAKMNTDAIKQSTSAMTPEEVALYTVRALDKNKAIIIPGRRNRWITRLPRLLSRWMTRKIAASVNKSYCPR